MENALKDVLEDAVAWTPALRAVALQSAALVEIAGIVSIWETVVTAWVIAMRNVPSLVTAATVKAALFPLLNHSQRRSSTRKPLEKLLEKPRNLLRGSREEEKVQDPIESE